MSNVNFWKRIESKASQADDGRMGNRVCRSIQEGIRELGGIHPRAALSEFMGKCVEAHNAIVAEARDQAACSLSVMAGGKAAGKLIARGLGRADDKVRDMVWEELKRATAPAATINNLGKAFPPEA